AFAAVMIPALLTATAAWIGFRYIEMGDVSFHHLVNGSGNEPPQTIPWIGLVYFIAMVIGMFAHTTWALLPPKATSARPKLDAWLYLPPTLVAPIVFLAVLKLIGASGFSVESLLLSFQNGFFWQTVMSKRT